MNKKIIVAEDSSVIQNLTKKILMQLSYDVTIVKDGTEVLQKLEDETYDLMLLDIHMPGMDGMTCTEKIRSSGKSYQEIPIIAITGNANNYSEDDFRKVGINAFVPKPLNYDLVVENVKKFI
ncbi:MAG: response regulator [Bacteroidota bacterium]